MSEDTTKAWVLDRRIDLGSILPLLALFFGVLAWGVRQEGRISALDEKIQTLDTATTKDRDNTREDLKEINRKMDRVLEQLVTLKR